MIREFKPEDYEVLMGWLDARGHKRFPKSYLPTKGWIADGLASIHLVQTDTSMAFIEFFITNPQADEKQRLAACDELISAAYAQAISSGYDTVCGYTKIPKVVALGLRYGFRYDNAPYYLFRKSLGENANG